MAAEEPVEIQGVYEGLHEEVAREAMRTCRKCLQDKAESEYYSYGPGRHTKADIDRLFILQKGKCVVCRVGLSDYHVDHVMPIALGGTNDAENLQLLCPDCNMKKGAIHPVAFMQSRGLLL